MTDLERLKMYTLESQFPMFSDEELEALLDLHDGDVAEAAFDACLQKSSNEKLTLGPISIEDNSAFWLRRADYVRGLELKRVADSETTDTVRRYPRRNSARRYDE